MRQAEIDDFPAQGTQIVRISAENPGNFGQQRTSPIVPALKIAPQAFSLCLLDFAGRGLVIDEEIMAIPAMSHFPLTIEIAGITAEHELASNSGEDVQ